MEQPQFPREVDCSERTGCCSGSREKTMFEQPRDIFRTFSQEILVWRRRSCLMATLISATISSTVEAVQSMI